MLPIPQGSEWQRQLLLLKDCPSDHPKAVFKQLRLQWLDTYSFENYLTQSHIKASGLIEQTSKVIDPRILWKGAYYRRSILANECEHVAVRWVGTQVGFGAFTKCALERGDYIGSYLGLVRHNPWWNRSVSSYCFTYPLQPCFTHRMRRGSWTIDALSAGNHTRFINHSHSPNATSLAAYLAPYFYIVIAAVKPIACGEQITYDYGLNYWKRRKDRVELDALPK